MFVPKVYAILGRRGSFKTCFAVRTCYLNQQRGKTIYSNINLNFPHERFTLDMLVTMPPQLQNTIVFIDEIQKWADAYKFFAKDSIALSNFVTQIRKLRVTLIFTTQFLRHTITRLRDQVDIIFIMKRVERGELSIAYVQELDATVFEGEDLILEFFFDGRRYFSMYDTNEIVFGRDEDKAKKVRKEKA